MAYDAWIESHQQLGRHPKTRKLARSLGISLPAAVGHLHFLWWWALDFAQDGMLTGFEPIDIADAALWEGDPDAFVSALIDCGIGEGDGFLSAIDGGYALHDWYEYAGKLLEKREADAVRKRTELSLRPSSSVWAQLRDLVFRRDNFTCQYCGERAGRLECDHIIPVSRGGSNEVANLATACFACNRSKHDKTLSEWRP